MIDIHPLFRIPEVKPGDDLAAILAEALLSSSLKIGPQDVLVVTQKIVSKAEGRFVDLRTVSPGEEARRLADLTKKDPRLIELVLGESIAVLRAVPNVFITRHRRGYVMANAGIDRSNIGSQDHELVLLLPEDGDASAALLYEALNQLLPTAPAIVISDSFGRPWRQGVVNVAIGAAGLASLIDKRGVLDRDGRALEVTQVAFADMVATAAGLAAGEAAEGIPAVLVRGLSWSTPVSPAAALIRPPELDLFR